MLTQNRTAKFQLRTLSIASTLFLGNQGCFTPAVLSPLPWITDKRNSSDTPLLTKAFLACLMSGSLTISETVELSGS
jgi:hypothetical protein